MGFGRMAALEFAGGWQPNIGFIRAREQGGPVHIDPKIQAKAKAKATTQWALGSCVVCDSQIQGGRVMDIPQLGGKLHAECFKCNACSTALPGVSFNVHAGMPYCSSCYGAKFGTKCVACGQGITGTMMKCSLGSYHPACAVCASCNNTIGRQFSTSTGTLLCQLCSLNPSRQDSIPREALSKQKPLSSAGNSMATRPVTPSGTRSGRASSCSAPKAHARKLPKATTPAATSHLLNASPSSSKARTPVTNRGRTPAKPKLSMAGAHSLVKGFAVDLASFER